MTLHFGTYHWCKNIVHGYQNIVEGCKITFGTLFLATPVRVALQRLRETTQKGEEEKEKKKREKKDYDGGDSKEQTPLRLWIYIDSSCGRRKGRTAASNSKPMFQKVVFIC